MKTITIFILKLVSRIHTIASFVLPIRKKIDWGNFKNRMKYPQTWYIVTKMLRRWKGKIEVGQEIFRNNKNIKRLEVIQSLCNSITGHEISKTERGYGGANMIDYHCRWCDKLIQIPMSEQPRDGKFLTDLWNSAEDNLPPGPGPASEFGQDKL